MNLKDYIGEVMAYDKKLMLERRDPMAQKIAYDWEVDGFVAK